jgi:hypothetical protein
MEAFGRRVGRLIALLCGPDFALNLRFIHAGVQVFNIGFLRASQLCADRAS